MKKLLATVVLVGCIALVGCGGGTAGVSGQPGDGGDVGSIVGTAKDNASVVACRTNRALLDQQYAVAQTESADGSVSFSSLVDSADVTCPSGGVYSWDEALRKTKCSVHGE